MKVKYIALFLLASVFLSGCSVFRSGSSYPDYETSFDEQSMLSESAFEYKSGDVAYETSSPTLDDSGGFVEGANQKVIKTGDLSLHVEDVRETVTLIKTKIAEWGGDVDSSSISRYDNSYLAYMTVRVESASFDAALGGLKDMALYTDSESTNAENVTEAYMDLEARLTSAEAEEAQYLDILDKATTVEEILQVTDYLSNVRYEIESLESQMQYYDSKVDYSTINLTLTEDESVSVAQESWRPLGTIRDALSDWLVFLQGFVDRVIYFVVFVWPIALVAGIVWYFLRRKHKKQR